MGEEVKWGREKGAWRIIPAHRFFKVGSQLAQTDVLPQPLFFPSECPRFASFLRMPLAARVKIENMLVRDGGRRSSG
jgi:hypothetical protein